MKLIGIGDNVCDVYIHMKTMYPGGQALNVAVYAGMLGAECAYIGVFGRDEVSDHIQKTLKELKVPFDHCRHYDGDNGYAKVTLIDGDRTFLGSNKGGVSRLYPLELSEEDLTYIRQFDVVHTSNNSFFDPEIKKLVNCGIPVSYDFSRQWLEQPEWVNELAPLCTFAFCSLPDEASEDEALSYCRSFTDAGAKMVIATLGSKGAYFYDGRNLLFEPSQYVVPLDTLGAGDSYTAAFLVNYYNGLEKNPEAAADKSSDAYLQFIKHAMNQAAGFAAKTCLVRGAFDHGKTIDPEFYLNKEVIR